MLRFQAFQLQPGPMEHLVSEKRAEEDLRQRGAERFVEVGLERQPVSIWTYPGDSTRRTCAGTGFDGSGLVCSEYDRKDEVLHECAVRATALRTMGESMMYAGCFMMWRVDGRH